MPVSRLMSSNRRFISSVWLGPSGLGLSYTAYLQLRTFQPGQVITTRMIYQKEARRSTKPIKSTNGVPATFLTIALLLSDMYHQLGIRAIAPPHYLGTVPATSISVPDDLSLSRLFVPVTESPVAMHFKASKTSMNFG